MLVVSFASPRYEGQQATLDRSCRVYGLKHYPVNSKMLREHSFYKANTHIFTERRGAGFWLWKPLVILEALKMDPVVIYLDASCIIVEDPTEWINSVVDIGISRNNAFPMHNWTRRDCFYYMDCDHEKYWNGHQAWAGSVVVKESGKDIIQKWLEYGSDRRIISDDRNVCGFDNLKTFKDHRHDQSILSLLAIKYPDRFTIREVVPFMDAPDFKGGEYYVGSESCQIKGLDDILQRYLGRKETGRFVEIGAHDGYSWSNTWGLAQRFWKGLYVEPHPELVRKCLGVHKDHKVVVRQVAAGSSLRTAKLYRGGDSLAVSTTNEEAMHESPFDYIYDPEDYIEVQMEPLDMILQAEKIPLGFDLLVIDVEGSELDVLAGFTLSTWMPTMLIIETHEGSHSSLKSKHASEISQIVEKEGYSKVQFDGTNTIFVRTDVS